MNIEKQKLLAELLREFFKDCDINAANFIYRNPVGSELKKGLVKAGRWKNLPRGKPRTSFNDDCPF